MTQSTSGKPRIYVAGPMRGKIFFAFYLFDFHRDRLKEHGWDVVSPADIDRAHGFDPFTLPHDFDWKTIPPGLDLDEIMLRDFDALETCDAIYMLRGWEDSDGAKKELEHANKLGLRVFYQDRENCGECHYPSAVVMEPPVMSDVSKSEEYIGPPDEGLLRNPLYRERVKAHKAEIFGEQLKAAAPDRVPVVATACQLPTGEVRVTDPVTGGQKGSKPAAFALIPSEPLWELATLYGYGAAKYDPDNWRKGYSWRLSFSACMRHLWAFWRGEDIDPESGIKHVVHAAWHCLTLAWFMDFRRGHDDRSKSEAKA